MIIFLILCLMKDEIFCNFLIGIIDVDLLRVKRHMILR